MQVSIAGHQFELSDRLKVYIEEELTKLERFYTPLLDCQVTLSQEGRTRRANVVVHVHAQVLKASHEADKVYIAVDGAMDKMGNQLKKLHDKRRHHRGGPEKSS